MKELVIDLAEYKECFERDRAEDKTRLDSYKQNQALKELLIKEWGG